MSKNSIIAGQLSGNLNFKTAQKMIHRLLTEGRIKTPLDEGRCIPNELPDYEPAAKLAPYTKKELADKFGISVENLDKLNSPSFYEGMINRISLSLITLYCATKFVAGEYKGE
jgi:hypothetical protein